MTLVPLHDPLRLATYTPISPADVIVFREGDYAVAVDGKTKEVLVRGTYCAEVIQKALGSLTPNRTWKETVVVIGDFVAEKSIVVPSYTRLILLGEVEADESFSISGYYAGLFEIGNAGDVIKGVEIAGGKVVGHYFTDYPTKSGKNTHIYGIHSSATLIDVHIHDIYFENLEGPILLEKLGANKGTPSRMITIENIRFKDVQVGVQTYANGYEYRDVLIEGIRAENCWDDVVAVVGHYGGVSGATPYVREVEVKDIIVYDKNGGAGAVVKLDAGDAADGGNGYMMNILVDGVVAYTSSPDDILVQLLKGGRTKDIYIRNVYGRGEFKYGIYLQGRQEQNFISHFKINANYGIFIFSSAPPSGWQYVRIEDGLLMPRESDVEAGTPAGMGIVLGAGTSTQGIRGLDVRGVKLRLLENPIYEGDNPPTGVRGTYEYNRYEVDIGGQSFSSLVITSDPVELIVYDRGNPITRRRGTAVIPAGSTSVTVNHGLAKAPKIILLTPAGNARVWYENVTDTSFDIVTDTAPSADLKIVWYAEV